jgi:hypothetical protein
MSSTPTNSLSVEIIVFNFCFVETEMRNPLPSVNPPPTMMNAPPPLLPTARCPLPHQGSPLQQDDGTVGAKSAMASATTVDEVSIVARAMSSSGAVTNAMDVVAWRQRSSRHRHRRRRHRRQSLSTTLICSSSSDDDV